MDYCNIDGDGSVEYEEFKYNDDFHEDVSTSEENGMSWDDEIPF